MEGQKRSLSSLRKSSGFSVRGFTEICASGSSETSLFEARCAFWNYAILERVSINFDRIARVATNYPGHDKWRGKGCVFVLGAYAFKEAQSLEGSFQESIFCHLSPYHIWESGSKQDRIENIVYLRPCTAKHFSVRGHNWIFHNILERTDCPQDWLEAASFAAADWVYVSLDTLGSRRMYEISVKEVKQAFPKNEFQGYAFDAEWVQWHEIESEDGRIWSNAVNPTFLFLRHRDE